MELEIRTKYGIVRGFEEDGLRKWFGIPFAKPPVGELRFKRTQEPEAWEGVKETTAFGPAPWQYMDLNLTGEDKPADTFVQSEDCLYLNIWAPKKAVKAPVFVWIYGGANAQGRSCDPGYDGSSFAKNGVIYVNYNYRVGPLGFYDFSIYDKSFDSNCGVADQIAGLKWIKENIEAFGGDPDNITIDGESAGGTAVYDMLAAPSARGLFSKAIAQSGIVDSGAEPARMVKLNMDLFLEKLGVSPDNIGVLKTMDPSEFKDAANFVLAHNNDPELYPGIFAPGPVQDDLLPVPVYEALAAGSAEGVDVIFGTMHDEGTIFVAGGMFPKDWETVERMLELNGLSELLPRFKELYGGSGSLYDQLCRHAHDLAFGTGCVKCLNAQAGHGRVWAYRMDFETKAAAKAGVHALHGSDVGHFLNTTRADDLPLLAGEDPEEIARFRRITHGIFLSFARTGNPNGSHLPVEWPEYDTQKRTTVILDRTCRLEENPEAERFELWKDIRLYV